MDFAFFIRTLKEKILSLTLQLKEAFKILDERDKEIELLEKRVKQLEHLINAPAKKVVKKTSRNSNLPASKEINTPKRNQSLRPKSDKKPGGQPGHKGHFLEMNTSPNKVIPIIPRSCLNCGQYLDTSKKQLTDSIQEIDIPPLQAFVTQYNSYQLKCNCGTINCGQFPDRLTAKVQYGPRLRSLINYLSTYQYLPYKRLQLFFQDLFGLHFSQGTIFNTLKRTAKKSAGIYDFLKDYIRTAKVVGADETVIKVNGQKYYNWVWQNKKITFIASEQSRKKDEIYKHFPHGFPSAILVSDRYAAQLSTPSKGYQICWSHLMRLLNYLIDAEDNEWIHKLIKLYRKAKKLEKRKTKWNPDEKEVKYLHKQLNQLLQEKLDHTAFPETLKLYNSLNINKNAIFTFLYHQDVPSHNNASEQAIRNAKVKMKISGQFKSGQNYFAITRSIIDTLIKNKKPVLESLFNIEKGNNISFGF